jgi:penicillin-binding protein 2
MRRVATGYSAFNVLWEYPIAGKTGTAQQTAMPDNALFVGYAPYYLENAWNAEEMSAIDKIALAVRIPNGYSSSYAAQLASDVFRIFYYPDTLEEIVGSVILNQGSSND